ncbi:DUF427 domain-containing protein [Aerococcus agrisoli]|uniref:DUF427 domain-containing protein n=1 Tax=Aerococcus agrisoli TaxID=2487350 RepID=A0A3N4GDS5_9LACT|nr:DUF427 domain-containing protein [Aerococcus agrisoli]RPA60993.1 DUF427 domain-containing protein [Aerococcus agrisoli]
MVKGDNHVKILIDPSPRRISVQFNGQVIADTKNALIVHERGRVPVYYFPSADVQTDYLIPTSLATQCVIKGTASYWTVTVGNRSAENAAWSYQTPLAGSEVLAGYISFDWDQMDAWFEEDEEIFEHARDPYTRLDAIPSTRHIQVIIDGEIVADSHRPVILYETGLTPRYYLPVEDIKMDVLVPSETHSRCPYKGYASYWDVNINGNVHKDVVWGYLEANPEVNEIRHLLSFYNEQVEAVIIDGEKWSLHSKARLPHTDVVQNSLKEGTN